MLEITPLELSQKLKESSVTIIDVRELEELGISSFPNYVHIPLGEISSSVEKIRSLADEKQLVVVCRSGGRSAMAIEFLESMGIDNMLNLAGGINAYARDVEPTFQIY